jgi:hypothetical protein
MSDKSESACDHLAAEVLTTLDLWNLGPNSRPPFADSARGKSVNRAYLVDGRLDAVVECLERGQAKGLGLRVGAEMVRDLAEQLIMELEMIDESPGGPPLEPAREKAIADFLRAGGMSHRARGADEHRQRSLADC